MIESSPFLQDSTSPAIIHLGLSFLQHAKGLLPLIVISQEVPVPSLGPPCDECCACFVLLVALKPAALLLYFWHDLCCSVAAAHCRLLMPLASHCSWPSMQTHSQRCCHGHWHVSCHRGIHQKSMAKKMTTTMRVRQLYNDSQGLLPAGGYRCPSLTL